MALARELLGLLGEARLFVARVLELRLVADDRFFVFVMFGVERRNRVHRMRDRRFNVRCLTRETGERVAIGGDYVTQLFDLALGFENAARFRMSAARDQVRSTEDVAVAGDDRTRRTRADAGCGVVRTGNPGVADRPAN